MRNGVIGRPQQHYVWRILGLDVRRDINQHRALGRAAQPFPQPFQSFVEDWPPVSVSNAILTVILTPNKRELAREVRAEAHACEHFRVLVRSGPNTHAEVLKHSL